MKRLSNFPGLLIVSLVFLLANSFAYATTDQDGDGIVETTITQIASGPLHGCVLDSNGVRCFGETAHEATAVPALSNPTAVTAGVKLSCAIDDSGVKCWSKYTVLKTVPVLNNPFALAAGDEFACALDVTGAHCWGSNNYTAVKNNIPALSNPSILSASYSHVCAIDDVGVHCWGDNSAGQLNVPTLVNPVAVSAGYLHTCAIDDSGVHCWGDNSYGQTNVPTLQNPVAITAAGYDTCAIDATGTHCWGSINAKVPSTWTFVQLNGDGVCGRDAFSVRCLGSYPFNEGDNCPLVSNVDQLNTDNDPYGDVCDGDDDNDGLTDAQEDACGSNSLSAGSTCPVNSPDTDGDGIFDSTVHPLQISSGSYHSCALDITGVSCWGANIDYQTSVPDLSNPLALSVGAYHSCALDMNGVKCWGQNTYYQSEVPVLSNPVAISAGYFHSCAIDGSTVKCWGAIDSWSDVVNYGQANVPVDLGSVTAIATGGFHSCAITSGNTVRCWGDNAVNQTTIPSLINPTAISAGFEHTCALDDDGVKCWGNNNLGQISVPVLENPTAVIVGLNHSCALDNTGVICWGDNTGQQLTVSSLLNPVAISAGGYHSCAIDASGVKCWGSNDYKQLDVPTHALFNNIADNCPSIINADQLNTDGDANGDDCDAFPLDPAETVDTDNDGTGNNADTDDDGDGDADGADNCPLISNADQLNSDGDSQGDACDTDDDNDGVSDTTDAFPLNSAESVDTDSDAVGDNADNCTAVSNSDQLNTDGDSQGNACDEDDDNDGAIDSSDAFPLDAAESKDKDGNGVGDNADVVEAEVVLTTLKSDFAAQAPGKEAVLQSYVAFLNSADDAIAKANQTAATYQLRLSQGAGKKELKAILKAQKSFQKSAAKLIKSAAKLAKKQKLTPSAVQLAEKIQNQQALIDDKK